MKLSLLLLTIVAALCSAQSVLQELPSCVLQCATQHLNETTCSLTDIDCLCGSVKFMADVETCAQPICSVRDLLAAKNVTTIACHQPVRDESRTIAALGPAITALALAFVAIRVGARWNMLGFDDLFVVLSFVTGMVASILNTLMASHGLGKDIWTVSVDNISYMLFLFYVSEPLYLASTIFIKISMCLFYKRIFPFPDFQITMWIIIGSCSVIGVGFALPLILQCSPVEYSWLFYLGEMQGKCIDRNAGTWAHASVNMVLDLVILALPIMQLYRLQTSYSTRKKVQIMFMFSVGIIVTIVSALRLRSLIVFMRSHNFTFDNLATAEWSVVEMNVGIICACLPAARIFFGRILPRVLGVTTNGSKHTAPAAYAENRRSVGRPPSWSRITHITLKDEERDIKVHRDFVRLEEVASDGASTTPMTRRNEFDR